MATRESQVLPLLTGSPQTVLIVDDDEEIRHLLRLLFETEGLEVVGEAADGPNGLALAIRHEPDVIILDYMMPWLNGAHTARLLRGVAPRSKIVAFSAVLTETPDWADSYLDKSRIGEVVPLLRLLLESGVSNLVGRRGIEPRTY